MKIVVGKFKYHAPHVYILIMGCLLLCGCLTTLPLQTDNRASYVMPYNADKRVVVFINKQKDAKENFYYCAEPSPDVAKDIKYNFNIEASDAAQKLGKITIANDFNASTMQIGQRTQMIMFVREALYRLCELSINNNITSEKAVELYEGVIKIATTIANEPVKQAEAKQAEAANIKKGLDLLDKGNVKDENLIKGLKELLVK